MCVVRINYEYRNTTLCRLHSFCYERNFIRAKVLILARNLRTSEEESQACCPTEQKNKVSSLAILKIIRTKHQNRAWLSLILYCMQTSSTLTTPSFLMTTSYSKIIHLSNLFVYIGQSSFTFLCMCHLSLLGVWEK